MPARKVLFAVLVFAWLCAPPAESQSRRCFIDQTDFVWDFTEVRRDAYVWFSGTVDRDGLDVRIASGVYDSSDGGHWIFQAAAGDLGPGFIYQLSPPVGCCESAGAWIEPSPFGSHGQTTVEETECDGPTRRNRVESSRQDAAKPGDRVNLRTEVPGRTGNFCLVDDYGYLWDLDVIDTAFGKKFFRGVMNTGRDLRAAVGIGSEDRSRIALATEKGDSVPFAYNIAWDDLLDSGIGSWIHADTDPGAGVVDWMSLTPCNDNPSAIERENSTPGPSPTNQ